MKPTPEGYFDRPVCQPVDVQGDGNGILLMHGFTGSPAHMRMLADDLAERGYTVRSICLPGHASTEEDMAKESWQSWLQAAKTAVLEMKKTCKTVTVCGLSMGGVLALLLVQVLGLPFCLLYMKLAARFGARTMVGVGICVYMFICIFAYFMNSLWQFWMLAVLCATSQGGIQALSRSMFGKLIPDKARSGEFFGFFDIFGKFSSILGPTLVGAVSAFAASKMMAAQGLTAVTATAEQVDAINKAASPYGILSVILIIIAGAVLYFAVLPRTLKGDQRKI